MNTDTEIELERLRNEVRVLHATIGQLRAEKNGETSLVDSWLQRKVHAQAVALNACNQRIVNQRFVLRNLERLGRGLTPEELATARALESVTVE